MQVADIFADIPEAPLREKLDPAIHVEPKDRDLADEDARQAALVSFLRRHARQVRVVGIPNAEKRTRWQAAKRKREGMMAGEPDLAISWADAPTARIEFKNGRAMPDDNQVEALNWYHCRDHPVAVCRTAIGAVTWLRSIGAPIPEIKS